MRCLVLLLFAVGSWGAIAEDDDRAHPVMVKVMEMYPDVLRLDRVGMRSVADAAQLHLQDGYRLAAIEVTRAGSARVALVANDVPADAVLILVENARYVAAIYQEDQASALVPIQECLCPESVSPNPDGYPGITIDDRSPYVNVR